MSEQAVSEINPSDIALLNKRQRQTFQLTLINFALFLVLFSALIYVSWQSSMLVKRLQASIDSAEQAVASIQSRIGNIDEGELFDRAVARIGENLRQSVTASIADSPGLSRVQEISTRVEELGTTVTETAEAVKAVSERIADMDSEAIANQVSYSLLKGMGEGFSNAAETRRPVEQ